MSDAVQSGPTPRARSNEALGRCPSSGSSREGKPGKVGKTPWEGGASESSAHLRRVLDALKGQACCVYLYEFTLSRTDGSKLPLDP